MDRNISDLLDKGVAARNQGGIQSARILLGIALAESRRMKDRESEASALLELSVIAIGIDKDFATGRQLLKDSLKIYTDMRVTLGRAYAMSNLGSLEIEEKNHETASHWFSDALSIFEQKNDKYGIAMTLHQMAKLDKVNGDFAVAEQRWRRCLLLFEGVGNKYAAAQALLSLAGLSYERNDWPQAKLLLSRARAIFQELGNMSGVEQVSGYIERIEKQEKA